MSTHNSKTLFGLWRVLLVIGLTACDSSGLTPVDSTPPADTPSLIAPSPTALARVSSSLPTAEIANDRRAAARHYARGLRLPCREGVEEYSEAIRLDRDYESAYVERALCYVQEEKYDLAMDDANKAIELN